MDICIYYLICGKYTINKYYDYYKNIMYICYRKINNYN